MNMKISTMHLSSFENFSVNTMKVEPISENLKGDVRNLLIQADPANRNISIDNALVILITYNSSVSILGVVCIEPNDVRTKYAIQGEDIEKRNYHELTYVLVDDRLLIKEEILITLLRQLMAMCVNTEPIDEVFWFSDRELCSKIIDKVFKTCNEYYFQNEAKYFANKLMSIYNEQKRRASSLEELRQKNAPE